MLEGMDKKNSYDLFWLDEDIMTIHVCNRRGYQAS